MLIQRINRTNAEQVFAVCENTSGQTLTTGTPVCWDTGGAGLAAASVGVAVRIPATSNLAAFAGIPQENIGKEAGTVGKIVVYGIASAVVHMGAASCSCAGLKVGPLNGDVSLQSTGYPTDGGIGVGLSAVPLVVVMSNNLSGPGTVNVFVRAM